MKKLLFLCTIYSCFLMPSFVYCASVVDEIRSIALRLILLLITPVIFLAFFLIKKSETQEKSGNKEENKLGV